MTEYIESFKRLYMNQEVTEEYINSRTFLSSEEKEYILSDEPIIEDTYENAYKILTGEIA